MGKSSSSSSSPLSSPSSSSLVSGYCCCSCKYSQVSGYAHAHVYKTRAYTTSCNAKKIQNGRYFYAMLKKESKILTQSGGQHFDFMWIMGLVANEKKRNCFWLLWRRSSHFIRCSNFNCVAITEIRLLLQFGLVSRKSHPSNTSLSRSSWRFYRWLR